jgi:hypothetical protein
MQDNNSEWEADQRIKLGKYLNERGLGLDEFCTEVRNIFVDSLHHYDRLAYRDALAECLGLKSEKDRDTLWKTIASPQGISRKVRIQWEIGELDPPPEVLKRHLLRIVCPGLQSKLTAFLDLNAPVQMGIARTLVYIRVFPPYDKGFQSGHPKEVQTCWDDLRRHAHYRLPKKKPRRDLNQHALDYVREKFGERFWIGPDEVGRVMREYERDRRGEHPWYWEFSTFKFATFADIPSTNRPKANDLLWLWDDSCSRFNEIWGLDGIARG